MSHHIGVRDATLGDLERLFVIRADARRKTYRSFLPEHAWRSFNIQNDVSEENLATWRAKAQKYFDHHIYIFRVATVDNEVIGWLLAERRGSGLHLMRLFVDPASQGMGVGGQLLSDMLKTQPYDRVTLTVLRPNQGAINFYEYHGFRVAGNARYSFLGVPCIRMERRP